jgi:hypothetical protein
MSIRTISRLSLMGALAGVSSLGCGIEKPNPDDAVAQTAMKLTVGPTTGVSDMHFLISPVDCATGVSTGAPVVDTTKPLDALRIPDGIPDLANHPLDSSSAHAFADDFEVLAAGCYDVATRPVLDGGVVCHDAQKKGVKVNEGKTTEVFLINQCDGMDPGALDVIAAINHPPVLTDVDFRASKFVATCGDQVICATAYDPEHDPLRFEWKTTAGPAVAGPFDVSSTTNPDGSITQCVRYIPSGPGTVSLTVTVFDLLHNNDSVLSPETIEKWLSDNGYPSPSHASLEFLFYSATGKRAPVAEICGDGLDNDCDGYVDADDSDCATIPVTGCPGDSVPICNNPLDLVLLEDLTGSFGDDLASVRSFSGSLASSLLVANAGTEFGVASFKDKPLMPFGSPGDYVYQLHLPLTSTPASFVAAIAGLSAGGGFDFPEAQLEALDLLAQDGAVGFRSAVSHFVVLATDAAPHVAPECVAAGVCTGPNNGDGVADPTEDYPTLAQVVSTMNAQGVTPIFAIAGGNESFYQPIVDALGRGRVLTLEPDSSNLRNAIFAGLPCHCGAP